MVVITKPSNSSISKINIYTDPNEGTSSKKADVIQEQVSLAGNFHENDLKTKENKISLILFVLV